MNKTLAIIGIALAVMTLASCSTEEKDPVRAAVMDKIMEDNPQLVRFDFTSFEKAKDVTLAEELNRRESLFKTQEKTFGKKAAEYAGKGMKNNVKKNKDKAEAATAIISRIGAYRSAHAAQLDSVIYSIYKFSGAGKTSDGVKIIAEDQCVTLSPSGAVYKLQSAGGNPCKGMGIAIPGYLEEIIGRADITEE